MAVADERPNIILFMTDDQNRNEMRWMPKTRDLIGGHGVRFPYALSPAPSCCPARAMTVTGQYGQNNGVQNNTGPYGGFHALLDGGNTLATWLQSAGYLTALAGKYLNGYAGHTPPPVAGWTRWNPSVMDIYAYFGTTFLEGSGLKTYTQNVTPVIEDYAERDIRAFSATGDPFFIWVSHLPPHGARGVSHFIPPKPTKKHAHVLGDVVLPAVRKPSFNVSGRAPVPYPGFPRASRKRVQAEFTGRLRTLQDVDDALESLVGVLRETHELRNTYIFFVSDNGMMLGEHRLVGKNRLYQEDLRIPLMVRIPGATEGSRSTIPVTTVDLAPTIAELAGASPQRVLDGKSFVAALHGGSPTWRDTQLVQTGSKRTDGPDPGWDLRGVYTSRFTYMRRAVDAAEFLYDREDDPYELFNRAGSDRYHAVLVELRRRYEALADCAGGSCNQDFGALPSLRPAT